MFGIVQDFSPKPASNKVSFSASVVGMVSWPLWSKHTNLCDHEMILVAALFGGGCRAGPPLRGSLCPTKAPSG